MKGSWKDDGFQQNLGHDWLKGKEPYNKIYISQVFFLVWRSGVGSAHRSLGLPSVARVEIMGGALWRNSGLVDLSSFSSLARLAEQWWHRRARAKRSSLRLAFQGSSWKLWSKHKVLRTATLLLRHHGSSLPSKVWHSLVGPGSFSNHEHELDMPILQSFVCKSIYLIALSA